MMFEMDIDNRTLLNEDYGFLREQAWIFKGPFQIYVRQMSKMHTLPQEEEEPPKEKSRKHLVRPPYIKMTPVQVITAIEELRRGHTKDKIRKKYHVSIDYLNAAIKDYQDKEK